MISRIEKAKLKLKINDSLAVLIAIACAQISYYESSHYLIEIV